MSRTQYPRVSGHSAAQATFSKQSSLLALYSENPFHTMLPEVETIEHETLLQASASCAIAANAADPSPIEASGHSANFSSYAPQGLAPSLPRPPNTAYLG